MKESSRLSRRFLKVRHEGDDVMTGLLLQLFNPVGMKPYFSANFRGDMLGDFPKLCLRFADQKLHLEHRFQAVVLRPDLRHLGQCVSFNHQFTGYR